jgi:hypothetical protein
MHPYEKAIIFLLELQRRHLNHDVRAEAALLEAEVKAEAAKRSKTSETVPGSE